LELNTLEDAYVNIGLKEEIPNVESNSKETIHRHQVPLSLNKHARYILSKQVKAMFYRRYFLTTRDFNNFTQLFISIALCNFSSSQKKEDSHAHSQMISFLLPVFYGFISTSIIYVAFIVREKEESIKYLLRTAGIRPLSYWLGTFLFDALLSLCFALLLIPVGWFL